MQISNLYILAVKMMSHWFLVRIFNAYFPNLWVCLAVCLRMLTEPTETAWGYLLCTTWLFSAVQWASIGLCNCYAIGYHLLHAGSNCSSNNYFLCCRYSSAQWWWTCESHHFKYWQNLCLNCVSCAYTLSANITGFFLVRPWITIFQAFYWRFCNQYIV